MSKRYWIGIIVSAVLVAVLLMRVDLGSVARAFREADMRYLLPAVLLYFLGIVPRALRWAILLRPVQPIGFPRLYQVLVVGFMANDILPFRAGEVVRAFMLWEKERVAPGATIATILVERIFDGLALTGFLVAGAMFVQLDDSLTWMTRAAAIIFAAATLAVLSLAIAPRLTIRLAELVLRPFPSGFSGLALRIIKSFEDGLRVLRSVRDTALVLVLSVLAWGLEAGMYFVLMNSFAFRPNYAAAVLGAAVANLASMVPSTPGYVGTFDAGLQAVLTGQFLVDASEALAYTTLVHATLILPVVALGLLFVWREGLSLKRIASREAYESAVKAKPADRAEATVPRSLP